MKIKWISNNQMELTIDCNKIHVITLQSVTGSIREVSNECLFRGIIDDDVKSVVAVSGCPGQQTIVSIASTLVEDGQVDFLVRSIRYVDI